MNVLHCQLLSIFTNQPNSLCTNSQCLVTIILFNVLQCITFSMNVLHRQLLSIFNNQPNNRVINRAPPPFHVLTNRNRKHEPTSGCTAAISWLTHWAELVKLLLANSMEEGPTAISFYVYMYTSKVPLSWTGAFQLGNCFVLSDSKKGILKRIQEHF